MKRNHWLLGASFGALTGLLVSSMAEAQIRSRCGEDQLATPEQGQGRNAWAMKCGYLAADDVDYQNRKGYYLVFTAGNLPTDPNAPCVGNLVIQGFCPVGCYHPETAVLFDGEEPAIASAALSSTRVTSLANGSTADRLMFELQDIESFTAGPTKKPLYWIRMADGRSLGVTHDHPIVLDSGLIVPARQIATQDSLLTVDGPARVRSVDILPYEGQVWNVQPVSEDKIANIHVANGVLTGSIRFQNQWASETFRLWQRARVDVSDI